MMSDKEPRGLAAEVTISTDGRAAFSERSRDVNESKIYDLVDLLPGDGSGIHPVPVDDLLLRVSIDEDNSLGVGFADGARLELSRYHFEVGGRFFHMEIAALLEWPDVERLRDFLNFAVANRSDIRRGPA